MFLEDWSLRDVDNCEIERRCWAESGYVRCNLFLVVFKGGNGKRQTLGLRFGSWVLVSGGFGRWGLVGGGGWRFEWVLRGIVRVWLFCVQGGVGVALRQSMCGPERVRRGKWDMNRRVLFSLGSRIFTLAYWPQWDFVLGVDQRREYDIWAWKWRLSKLQPLS
jgi:hypothetical protein